MITYKVSRLFQHDQMQIRWLFQFLFVCLQVQKHRILDIKQQEVRDKIW